MVLYHNQSKGQRHFQRKEYVAIGYNERVKIVSSLRDQDWTNLYYRLKDDTACSCYSRQWKKEDDRSGKERQWCIHRHIISRIYIARVNFMGRICPQPAKLNGVLRHAFTIPDQVDICDQVPPCAYWSDQIDQSISCWDCRLSERQAVFLWRWQLNWQSAKSINPVRDFNSNSYRSGCCWFESNPPPSGMLTAKTLGSTWLLIMNQMHPENRDTGRQSERLPAE